ncbi:MAG: ribonuclease D, partial [Cycloclasticus sp.]
FTEKFGLAIIDIITAAIENKPVPKDIQKKPNKVSEKEEALADLLMAQVRLKAADANVNPSSLTSRKELIQLIQGQRDLELLTDWRNEMIGQDLMATLNGLHIFQVVSGELNIST